ncbi:hypothetical protein [Gluconobacter aidae]|uniref:Uncharacterized protein n=1 Tax=Gluconobacter aidae TaxID=2662454 RepID=A0A7X1SQH2_9PROT|nr:hypothetical protein [Gluconobacter aidae]MQR99319.1 hypothetical protein [Gluconobacter aidae]
MANLDFITNSLRRLLPVREVEVPMLGEDLDCVIEAALRDLGAITFALERVAETPEDRRAVAAYASHCVEEISIRLKRAWRDERGRCGMDTDVDIGWLSDF